MPVADTTFRSSVSHTIRQLFFCCLVITAVLLTSGQAFSRDHDTLKDIYIAAIVNSRTHEIALDILQTAYDKIGFHALFIKMPGKRCLEYANSGKLDGDTARIEGTEKKYSNLVRVKVAVLYFEGVAFTKESSLVIRNWEDLKGLRVGIISGIRYSEIGTRGMNVFHANDMLHLFRLLSYDRIQVAIATRQAGLIEIQRNFENSGLRVNGPALHSAPLYHFLHKKNKHLVSPLENVLMEMNLSGEFMRLKQATLNRLYIEDF